MSHIFFYMMLGAMGAVLASLALGLLAMARGGETSKKYSNKLMQARVILQGLAILLFVLAIVSAQHGR